jgi:hypothetical protein
MVGARACANVDCRAVVVAGTLITQRDLELHMSTWITAPVGAMIALYTFMESAIRVFARGEDVVRSVLPTQFNWAMFLLALALMALPIAIILSGRNDLQKIPR